MKKIFELVIIILLMFSFVSCSKENHVIKEAEQLLLDAGYMITYNSDNNPDDLKKKNESLNRYSDENINPKINYDMHMECTRWVEYENNTLVEGKQEVLYRFCVFMELGSYAQAKHMYDKYLERINSTKAEDMMPAKVQVNDRYFAYISASNNELLEEMKELLSIIGFE